MTDKLLLTYLNKPLEGLRPYLNNVPQMPIDMALNLTKNFLLIYEISGEGYSQDWIDHIYLPEKLKKKLKNRTAIVYYDQSWEGFPMTEHFEKLYATFKKSELPPSQFVFSTSNLLEKDMHDKWCNQQSIEDRMTVISASFFAALSSHQNLFKGELTRNEHLTYKSSNSIKLFNCLNRVLREHRICFLAMLNYYSLLDSNKVSHNKFDTKINLSHPAFENSNMNDVLSKLPLILDSNEFEVNKADSFYKEVYLESWVTVVTETIATETNTMFFSEKIFKPMRARHPFILVGLPGSLRQLKEQGFKTFDTWWDESYDDIENVTERMEAICKVLLTLQKTTKEDWFDIYNEMSFVLKHNYDHLHASDWVEPLTAWTTNLTNE